MNKNLNLIVLAGGLGKIMKSKLPKVLHEYKEKPILVHVIQTSLRLKPKKILLIVGEFRPVIEVELNKWDLLEHVEFVMQNEPLGTGHAVFCAVGRLSHENAETNIILNGDCPIIEYETLLEIIKNFRKNRYNLQITTLEITNPIGCGRILRDVDGIFRGIIEEKDCNKDESKINEVNIGIFVAKSHVLRKYLPMIRNDNKQNEYYLTDIAKLYLENSRKKIGVLKLGSVKESDFINVKTS